MNEHVLVTGCAGFIGFHLSKRLLEEGYTVTGIDNLSPYYDPALKLDRLQQILKNKKFTFYHVDISDQDITKVLFDSKKFDTVVNLAAQAGVRYSLKHPDVYIKTNIQGFANILEGCRHNGVKHLVYASSSSVYGKNTELPFSVKQRTESPISLYAATKKSNELMAHTYNHLFGLPCTGLRYFTVYGPWGRPDMALFIFTQRMLKDRPIQIYNNGDMLRDFTYIDDIVEGTLRVIQRIPDENVVYNIGNNHPVVLLDFICELEVALGMTAKKEFLPLQPGDVKSTYADMIDFISDFNFYPKTSIKEGIGKFVEWYKDYYNVES